MLPIVTEGSLAETGTSLCRENHLACALRVMVTGLLFWVLYLFFFLRWARQGTGRENVV